MQVGAGMGRLSGLSLILSVQQRLALHRTPGDPRAPSPHPFITVASALSHHPDLGCRCDGNCCLGEAISLTFGFFLAAGPAFGFVPQGPLPGDHTLGGGKPTCWASRVQVQPQKRMTFLSLEIIMDNFYHTFYINYFQNFQDNIWPVEEPRLNQTFLHTC